ncbi:hypothetical protein BGZ49_005181 [Haplosporangium sp. Z 27]|nr:hypothetical protein BGZ49_005181 [Haplosporangium sp. Z 27]
MLNWEILNNPMLLELTKEYYLPLAQQLEIGSMYFENYQIQAQESKKMKNILGRCSNKLKKLIIDCEIYSRDDGDNAEENRGQEHGQAESTFKLEELILRRCSITDKENNFWLWFWRRCDSLKRIGIGGAVSPVESLSKVMSTRMPNLCKIQLGVDSGNYHGSSPCMPDEKSATLVSGCRNG